MFEHKIHLYVKKVMQRKEFAMKKVDPKTLEKFAKEKNIDKNKVEKIAEGYKGKSEDELIDELVKIGKNLKGKEDVVSKFKSFLDTEQQKKLDNIMNKITDAEVQEKIKKNAKKTKSINKTTKNKVEESTPPTKKKVKKVKRVKKSSNHDNSLEN